MHYNPIPMQYKLIPVHCNLIAALQPDPLAAQTDPHAQQPDLSLSESTHSASKVSTCPSHALSKPCLVQAPPPGYHVVWGSHYSSAILQHRVRVFPGDCPGASACALFHSLSVYPGTNPWSGFDSTGLIAYILVQRSAYWCACMGVHR